jgi:hypothetical protein
MLVVLVIKAINRILIIQKFYLIYKILKITLFSRIYYIIRSY